MINPCCRRFLIKKTFWSRFLGVRVSYGTVPYGNAILLVTLWRHDILDLNGDEYGLFHPGRLILGILSWDNCPVW